MATNEIRTVYRANIWEQDGRTGIRLTSEKRARIVDAAGRRQHTKEVRARFAEDPVELVPMLTMQQAVGLLESLVEQVGFMATDHPDTKADAR